MSPCSISTWFTSMVTFIGIRCPPRTLPTPPWRRRTLCPLLISLSSFFLFQLLQGWQCLFEVRSVLHRHRSGTCLVWTKPPFNLVMIICLWGQMVSMIFVRKNIHLSTNIFVSTIFNHSIAECFISYDNTSSHFCVESLKRFSFWWLSINFWSPRWLLCRHRGSSSLSDCP